MKLPDNRPRNYPGFKTPYKSTLFIQANHVNLPYKEAIIAYYDPYKD
jgi:hypothetical protein